tara:strand:- start:22 stop:897 length:876 start_codon:yes stop_codon:yes gene_type:complete
MPITTLLFSIDPQSTGAAIGDAAYYIESGNLVATGGFDTSSSVNNIVNMGTITGFGFQNASNDAATKSTHVIVFTNESFNDQINVDYHANSPIPYSNSEDFPNTIVTGFFLYYNGSGAYTQNQVVNPGVITSSGAAESKVIGVAASGTAAGRAANFKSAIEFATNGAMTCALSTTSVANDTLTVTQNVAGESGNVPVDNTFGNMASITSSFPNAFTNGADAVTNFEGYTMTVQTDNLYDLPTANDYVFFSTDNSVNLSSLIGYYAEPKFVNDSTEYAELFSVGLGVTESSK